MAELRELHGLSFYDATIIEQRSDKNIGGRIGSRDEYRITWRQYDGKRRTTKFNPECWRCDRIRGVIILNRVKPDPESPNQPWPDANQYIVII
ncbi:MAG: hypothetical protein ABIA47_03890 [bacterium]